MYNIFIYIYIYIYIVVVVLINIKHVIRVLNISSYPLHPLPFPRLYANILTLQREIYLYIFTCLQFFHKK